MDRIDLRARLHGGAGTTFDSEVSESSEVVRARVTTARRAAVDRWREYGWTTNAEVPGHALRQKFPLPKDAVAPVEAALRVGRMSARGADRALRVAWTICDLRGGELPTARDVLLALNFRQRDAQ